MEMHKIIPKLFPQQQQLMKQLYTIAASILFASSCIRCSEHSQSSHGLMHKKRKDEIENSIRKNFMFDCNISISQIIGSAFSSDGVVTKRNDHRC